jgi:hypothetical protein
MDIRKIAVVGSFAAGAAMAFAPLAAADPAAVPDPLISVVSGEISSLNALFVGEATLAGKGADLIAPTASNPFETIPLADAPLNGTGLLDSFLYGVDPLEAGPASDPGSYNVFNGALTELYDAYNVELYALLNNGAMMSDAVGATDLIGSSTTIDNALDMATVQDAATYFFNFGLGDLQGFFDFPS